MVAGMGLPLCIFSFSLSRLQPYIDNIHTYNTNAGLEDAVATANIPEVATMHVVTARRPSVIPDPSGESTQVEDFVPVTYFR